MQTRFLGERSYEENAAPRRLQQRPQHARELAAAVGHVGGAGGPPADALLKANKLWLMCAASAWQMECRPFSFPARSTKAVADPADPADPAARTR